MKVNLAFNKEGIKAHNFLRGLHGCPPLTMCLTLAESAQAYAEVLVLNTGFRHSGLSGVGENLAKLSGKSPMEDLSATQVTLLWYDEIKNYHFVGEDPIHCGHFSQLIWQSTTAMGMGIAGSADREAVVVVAHYRPPGNRTGQWGTNVPRVLHGTPHTFTLPELTKAMNLDSESYKSRTSVAVRNPKCLSQDANQTAGEETAATEFVSTIPELANEGESERNASKVTAAVAPLNGRQTDESEVFAMEVFMALNQRRISLGLPPFLLNEDLDHLARELAKELISSDSRDIPEGEWQGRRTRHYSERSCLLDRDAAKFVRWRYFSKLRMSVADPNCKYVTIGCELNPPFKRSSVVLLFA